MQRGRFVWLKLAALTPLMALYGSNGCTADTLHAVAGGADELANRLDDNNNNDVDLGDLLSNLVEDL